MVGVLGQNHGDLGPKFWSISQHLHIGCQYLCFCGVGHAVKVVVDQSKLVFERLSVLRRDQVTIFSEDVGPNFDHGFMKSSRFHHVVEFEGSVSLQLLIWLSVTKTSNDLGNSEPEIFVHIVSRILNELDDDVDVPI